MPLFDPTQGPVTIATVNKGISFQVLQARQSDAPVGAYRIDWNRSGAGIQTVVGHGHVGYLTHFERLSVLVYGYTGRFTILTDFWDMPTYDSPFRTGETECLVKNRDKHES